MSERGKSYRDESFTAQLLKKLAGVLKDNNDIKTEALRKEVMRQLKQSNTGGDPIKGEGVTKSGEES